MPHARPHLRTLLTALPLALACTGGDTSFVCAPDPATDASLAVRGPFPELTLEEVWRVGGLVPGQDLADPFVIAPGSDGWVAVVDRQLSEVVLIEPGGGWRSSLSRRGAGPGELQWPAAASWDGEGRLRILDLAVPKVVIYEVGATAVALNPAAAPDSMAPATFVEEERVDPAVFAAARRSGQLPGVLLAPDGAILLEAPWARGPGATDSNRRIARVLLHEAVEGWPADTLLEARTETIGIGPLADFPFPTGLRPLYAILEDGGLALGGYRAGPELRRIDRATGHLTRVCVETPESTGDARPAGDETGGADRTPGARGSTGAPPQDTASPFPGLEAAIVESGGPTDTASFGRIFAGGSDRVWLQLDLPSAATGGDPLVPGATYLVVDLAGSAVGRVTAPAGVVLLSAATDPASSRTLVYGVERGPFDEPWVVAYEVR